MRISVAEAEGKLTELVKRAESGEKVVLTRDGDPLLELVRIARTPLLPSERRKVFDKIRDSKQAWSPEFETDAAHSQDFLYDKDGLPG
ncbi:type II toxin-antitoxin system prevent-host-death family antitoxin [Neorhizobium lilium]|uniref:Type II toxin-antitoxin system prevent-host-death family antitoxin n=1 Tax=Neorhizobium lilium TaxID=2503024 RepID=A0A3S3RLB7_9HYPH|nr:type II toxin-antitoxin system prevent-host-death family antitoxin [Neorhizobium lilium]RWX79128.1 type II toxin-antitoxin system prevent-host-death family antitoxin [Neorhizobium lilium]